MSKELVFILSCIAFSSCGSSNDGLNVGDGVVNVDEALCNDLAGKLLLMGMANQLDVAMMIGNRSMAKCIDRKIDVKCSKNECEFKGR